MRIEGGALSQRLVFEIHGLKASLKRANLDGRVRSLPLVEYQRATIDPAASAVIGDDSIPFTGSMLDLHRGVSGISEDSSLS